MNKGVLLVNLGSPDSPSVADVRRYLREFLMDGRVLDVNWLVRFCIVNFAILPSRPKQSAEAYHKIWTPAGSPLVVTSRNVQAKLQQRVTGAGRAGDALPAPVHPGSGAQPGAKGRGRSPAHSPVPALCDVELRDRRGAGEGSGRGDRAENAAAGAAAVLRPARLHCGAGGQRAGVSPAGLRPSAVQLSRPAGAAHAQGRSHRAATVWPTENCCETPSPAHATCYRAQCFKTVAAFVKQAGVPKEKYSVAFQSRLGRDPWLKPYTDYEIPRLAERGVKKLLVICPAFVADCLETLEEIGMRGRDAFLAAGGTDFALIPCLNEHPLWLTALEKMVSRFVTPANRTLAAARPTRSNRQ